MEVSVFSRARATAWPTSVIAQSPQGVRPRAFKNIRHLLPGRKGSKNALSRDRNRSGFGCGGERVSPVAPESLGGDEDPAEHVAGSDRVDGDDLRRRYAKRIVGRDKSSAIGAEGQNNRAGALLAQLARGLFRFAARKVNRLAAVDQHEINHASSRNPQPRRLAMG